MSEEFLRIARKEVSDDVAGIGNLLQKCKTDSDVVKNVSDIEKHVHKIKGLAPMMGQEQIGQIAAMLDKILKTILAGQPVSVSYQTLKDSHEFMKNAIDGNPQGFDVLVQQIQRNHKDLL